VTNATGVVVFCNHFFFTQLCQLLCGGIRVDETFTVPRLLLISGDDMMYSSSLSAVIFGDLPSIPL